MDRLDERRFHWTAQFFPENLEVEKIDDEHDEFAAMNGGLIISYSLPAARWIPARISGRDPKMALSLWVSRDWLILSLMAHEAVESSLMSRWPIVIGVLTSWDWIVVGLYGWDSGIVDGLLSHTRRRHSGRRIILPRGREKLQLVNNNVISKSWAWYTYLILTNLNQHSGF